MYAQSNYDVANPETVFAIVNEVTGTDGGEGLPDERRISNRISVFTPIKIRFLDAQFEMIGEPSEGICRNVSMGGLALITAAEIDAEYCEVCFPEFGDQILLVLIQHRRGIGGLSDVGGSFVVDWGAGSDEATA